MTDKADKTKKTKIIIPDLLEETTVKLMYDIHRQIYELQTHIRSIETQLTYIYDELDQKVSKH